MKRPFLRRTTVPVYALAAITSAMVACQQGGDSPPLDRSKAPELGSPAPLQLPPVVRKELGNGLDVLMVEHHELPVVTFILLVGSGSEMDPDGKEGLATLAASLLDEGTEARDALAIADQAAFLGATLSTTGGWDASRVSLETTTAQLDSALALFADVVLHPTFPEAEFERLRRERLTTLLQIQDNPTQIADIVFSRVVFGEAHPYGQPQLGTEKSVQGLTQAEIRQFYSQFYRPNNSTLIVVGDFKPADMERRVQNLFATWERRDVPTATFPAPPAREKTVIYLVDKPGAAQSSVRIGHLGVPRSTPDYFGLVVANTILGGSFTSRLNMNLRETKGFTYGASSRFDMRKSQGPFQARAEIVAAKTDSAIIEFMRELNAIREVVPQDELDKAKRYLQLQLPNAFETTGDIANQLVPIAIHGLPLDYYNSYVQSIEGIAPADVQRIAAARVEPAHLAIVIVGDRRLIEPGLRKLSVGEITIRDLNGAPVSR